MACLLRLLSACQHGVLHYKNVPLYFHYNSCVSWWSFSLYVPVETGMNTMQKRYKIYNFTLTVSSVVAVVSAVRDDSGRRLPAAFDQTGCAQLLQKVVQCLCFQFLSGYSLISLWAENLLDSYRFWLKKIYLQNSAYSFIPFHCVIIAH